MPVREESHGSETALPFPGVAEPPVHYGEQTVSGRLTSTAHPKRHADAESSAETGAFGLPLPLGEGWGEGEIKKAATIDSPHQAAAADWDGLARQVAACTACSLHQIRTQTVFGVGNRQADWLVIGEAPGEQEDLKGEPFVGRAGQLLNEMLRAVGHPRDVVYIANVLKCRPPGNRDPKPEEAAACEPYLRRQVALLQPSIILAVGRIAAQNLLKTDAPLSKLRGRVHRYGDIPLVVVYHPAYLLRSPGEKRKAWDDLRLALAAYRKVTA
ncbi:MAG: uracil-DNA glycosylase [Methylococcaceae bacterium]|nr:MAG: uracil-DNA glycosylase [Methylococcaceae bacterium]